MSFVWQYPAVIDRVVDGDTVVCHIRMSAEMEVHEVNVRLEGINDRRILPDKAHRSSPLCCR